MRYQIYIFTLIISLLLFTVPLYAKQDGNKSNPGQDKKQEALIGNVDSLTNSSVIVEEKKGNKTETQIDKTTKVVGKDKKTLRLNQLKLKDKVAIISTDSANATGSGKKKALKIFVKQLNATESAELKKRAVHGIIQSMSGSLLTVVHQIQQDRATNVLINSATVIKSKNQTATGSASLQVGQRIVALGDPQTDGSLLAKRIHVIPGKAKGVFKRFNVATPSATISPSASASPTLTIAPTETTTPSATPTLSETPTPTL